MRRLSGYPRWFHGALLVVLLLLLGSGVLLIPDMLEMRMDWPSPVHLSGAFRLQSAVLHSLTGFLTVAALGSLVALHARIGWQQRRNRVTGVALLLLFAALLVTAVGIYYLGDPVLGRGASLVHTLAGFAGTALFVRHGLVGRRLRRHAARSGAAPRRGHTPARPRALTWCGGSPHRPKRRRRRSAEGTTNALPADLAASR